MKNMTSFLGILFSQSSYNLNKSTSSNKDFHWNLFTFFITKLERIPASVKLSKCFILLEHFVQMSDGSLWYFCFFKISPCPKLLGRNPVFMWVIGIGIVSFQMSFMIDYITWGDSIATPNENLDWFAILHGHHLFGYFELSFPCKREKGLTWKVTSAKTIDHQIVCEICLVFKSLCFYSLCLW